MDASVNDRSFKRRRLDRRSQAATSLPAPRATSSNSSSSTSSDILVASAQPTAQQDQRKCSTMGVRAVVLQGRLIVKGVGWLLNDFNNPKYRPNPEWDPVNYFNQFERLSRNDDATDGPASSLTETKPLLDDDEGPNHKGTYSKAYTLRHPETKWVHRGQGRYLPVNSVSSQDSRAYATSTPPTKSYQTPRASGRSSLRRRSGDANGDEDDYDEDDDLQFDPQHSKRLSDSSYSLRRRQSEVESLTPGQLRTARHNRRSGPSNFEDDENAEYHEYSSDEDTVTYGKAYVDSHPEIDWRHCGNGFYKKVTKRPAPQHRQDSRRGSNRSQLKAENEFIENGISRRYHSTELKNHPGAQFVHRGNGWYIRSSTSQSVDDQTAIESSEEENEVIGSKNSKFSKEEMIAYKNQHPDANFIHRGAGRYVLEDDTGAAVAVPLAKAPVEEPGQTFSKAHVLANPQESFYHAGSGRYRRGSRPHRVSDAPRKPETPALAEEISSPSGLVNKEFVLAHPEMEFHHRGQGRYAFGPRPQEPPQAVTPATPVEDDAKSFISDTELVDTAFVQSHPNETFHHRGQGRWARGLPPPGSSNKTAVRGPMASQAKVSTTPSHPPAEDLPGLDELLIRAEGPDKFPQLGWFYRGGGKWARTPKNKGAAESKPSRARGSRGKSLADGSQDWMGTRQSKVLYSDDEDQAVDGDMEFPDVESRRQSLDGVNGLGSVARRRQRSLWLPHQSVEAARTASKNPSVKSKTATPRPQKLTLEEDRLSDDENYPALHASAWPPPSADEPFDEASKLGRQLYKPLNPPELFVNALTRKDPAIRPKEVLRATTDHVQALLAKVQKEYLELDKITAPHARIARKPVKGGRVPLDSAVYEDRKEADLYDYTFDSRKVGFQDPDAQKIIRDADGRALRKRRNRNGLDVEAAAATTGGEDAALGPRRAVKPVSRFDGISEAPTRKKRTTTGTLKAASETPDPTAPGSAPQPQVLPDGYVVRTTGRWKNHIPKRIRELRGDSLGATQPNGAASTTVDDGTGTVRSETPGSASDSTAAVDSKDGSPGPVRKGRPKGSKNLHKRRDAGIPKGPRKPKVVASIEGAVPSRVPSTQPQLSVPNPEVPRDDRNDPWNRLGSSRIGYPFD